MYKLIFQPQNNSSLSVHGERVKMFVPQGNGEDKMEKKNPLPREKDCNFGLIQEKRIVTLD